MCTKGSFRLFRSVYKKVMETKIHKINLILFGTLVLGFLIMLILPKKVLASDCTQVYGGGEICNKSFDIEKKVRIKGDNSWKDKVEDVDEDDVVEFRIKIKNTGEIEVDDMKMIDDLPDELYKTGGDGLTEYWDNFEPGETKEFRTEVKIDSDEFDRDDDFEKCVVNKVEVTYKDKHEASDTAQVCYGEKEEKEIKELPETGPGFTTGAMTLLGLGLMGFGTVIKKSSKYAL